MEQVSHTPMLHFQGMCLSVAAFELEQIKNISATAGVEANLCSWPFGFQTLVVMACIANAQMVSHQQFPHLICLPCCAEDLLKIAASLNHWLWWPNPAVSQTTLVIPAHRSCIAC